MFKHSKDYCVGYTEECVQPNALDITIDKLFRIGDESQSYTFAPEVVIRKDRTTHAVKTEIDPVDGILFVLGPGTYSFDSQIWCQIPEGIVGWLVTRSSLNRNGIFVLSGVYDSGFNGHVGGTIYTDKLIHIEKGARVAQLITAAAETAHLYNGQYQSEIQVQ